MGLLIFGKLLSDGSAGPPHFLVAVLVFAYHGIYPVPVLDAGKNQRFIGQHGKEAVGVLAGRDLRKVGGQLYHEMRLVGAVRGGQLFQSRNNTLGLVPDQAVMQRRDMGFEVARLKLFPAFLFLPQHFPQVFRLIGLCLIPQERPQLGVGVAVKVQAGGCSRSLFS